MKHEVNHGEQNTCKGDRCKELSGFSHDQSDKEISAELLHPAGVI